MAVYGIYYPSGCDAEVGEHYCSDCPTFEHGRIGAGAFIKNDFEFTDPSNPTEWVNGIKAKDIIILPNIRGTFDGGSEVEGPGYGRKSTQFLGYNFSATFLDPVYKENATFYNSIKRSSNYRFAYVTETQVHITEVPVQAIPKNPVEEDTNSIINWNVVVKWADSDLPIPYDAPAGIFDTCFDYTGAIT